MPTLCDANVLLALCYDRHVHHAAALAWLDAQRVGEIVLCRSTQLSLLRLLCHASVMGKQVCTTEQAWSVYDAIRDDKRFCFYPEADPELLETRLRALTRSSQALPNAWQDAYLAAFALAAELRLTTFDQGFRRFNGLKLTLLSELNSG